MIVYIVGPATAKAVQALGFPASSIHGAHCGTGDVLSDFIPGHYRSIASGRITSKKFLFLVGEIRRDIIPKKLGAAGFSVEEVVVYDTQVVTGFGEHFSDVLGLTGDEATYGDKQRQLIRWVTIFSPAGSDIAMNILGRRRSLKSSEKRDSGSLGEVFVATIGPTTAAHLRDVLGVEPDVIAAKPSPEGLLEGMEQFLNKVGLEMPK